MPTVLIELPDGEGVVRRDDGEIVVSQDVSGDRGQPLCGSDHHRPVKRWLDGDRSLVGEAAARTAQPTAAVAPGGTT